jgi:hypothetical protein
MITINPFGFQTLTTAVNQMKPVPQFVKNLLFGRVETNATKTVMVDVIVGGQKVAPFVKRGNPARVIGNLGQKANIVEPPQIRLKKFLRPSDLFYTRGADAQMFVPGGIAGNDPIQQARQDRMAREQKDLKDIIDRTVEFLCCKGLSGAYSIAQDDGTFSIDFSMPSANKPTAAVLWSTSATAKPTKDMRSWKTIAQKASGKIPTVAIMNSTTYEAWIATTDVQTFLDKWKINIGQINTEQSNINAGAEKRATVDGVDYYVYDGIYIDKDGNQQSLIPDGYVSLVSPNADHRLQFAGVEDLEAGTVVAQYFSKDWIEKDPSGLWLLVESHPLPTFNEPAANIYAKVL